MSNEGKMSEFDRCPLHPDHEKKLKCRRFGIAICDHPDCAKCVQPYSLCKFRDECEIWAVQGTGKR